MHELIMHRSDIPFLSGFAGKEIVGHLLSRVGTFPAYDYVKVTRAPDLIVCDFFRNGVQVARVRAETPRFLG
jgi:hypothetical protein